MKFEVAKFIDGEYVFLKKDKIEKERVFDMYIGFLVGIITVTAMIASGLVSVGY